MPKVTTHDQESQRVLAGVLGILFGWLGVHRFFLDDVPGGVLRIVLTIVTCGYGAVIGFIEGIIYLSKSDAAFVEIYQIGRKSWF